ncbi:endonuclease/exonuclease/phosphatase family protein [Dinoroseobacter sp. PD6]|uniref:endonuclease/exonuclease/phosphatase family protein n=1 Tax=Dinoroseobacter sp. PD6 TaxID=3028384 RepID=UPI00237BBF76|nr:endonuclease/exonuclease/phosphatase family protein [Dinoroseobacter sp. PD6]MDD9717369.1 endonuclease/exonuclease/phosphatase family protein [Dinoroseobacter sp. PD6]
MTEFTLASWNIRAGLGRDLRRRPLRTIEVITGLDADILVLQEADFRMQPRPAALPAPRGRIGPFRVIDLTPDAVGLGWHGIAVLKHPAVKVDGIRRYDLPALEPRGAVVVDIRVRQCPLRVVGVHLGLLRGNRRKQIAYIAEQLAALDKRPTIIAGDFNEWRERKGLETLPDWLRTHSPGPTFPAGRPLLKLDKIAMSHDITLMDSVVVGDPAAKVASDHRPIWARFRLAPEHEEA